MSNGYVLSLHFLKNSVISQKFRYFLLTLFLKTVIMFSYFPLFENFGMFTSQFFRYLKGFVMKETDIIEIDEMSELREIKVKKLNSLIEGRNSNTLQQNQIMDFSLAVAKMNEDGILEADWDVSMLENYPKIDRHNISRVLDEMEDSEATINKSYTIYHKEGGYTKIALIDTFKYDHMGHVHVRFTHGISSMYENFKENPYTSNDFAINSEFDKNLSYKIFWICSKYAFELYKYNKYQIRVNYDLYELKSKVYPSDRYEICEKELKKKLGRTPTAKEVYETYPDEKELEKYKSWYDFKRYVLDRAKIEINEICKLKQVEYPFEFDYKKIGKKKVTGVEFIITKSAVATSSGNKEDDLETEEEETVVPFEIDVEKINEVLDMFVNGEPVTNRDAEVLLKTSFNDIDSIKNAYALAREQDGLRNIIGFMVKAIDENWNNICSSKGYSYDETKAFNEFKDDFNLKHYGTTDRDEVQRQINRQTTKFVDSVEESKKVNTGILEESLPFFPVQFDGEQIDMEQYMAEIRKFSEQLYNRMAGNSEK